MHLATGWRLNEESLFGLALIALHAKEIIENVRMPACSTLWRIAFRACVAESIMNLFRFCEINDMCELFDIFHYFSIDWFSFPTSNGVARTAGIDEGPQSSQEFGGAYP